MMFGCLFTDVVDVGEFREFLFKIADLKILTIYNSVGISIKCVLHANDTDSVL